MNAKMPVLFLSHGAPTLAVESSPTSAFLRRLADDIPRPAAIVMISAHWETKQPMLTGALHLDTIHDFHGFPSELYALRYPTPGNPALAARIRDILQAAGIDAAIDPIRGLDHGAWNPLILLYPNADIPVIQLSVQPRQDSHWHYHIGQLLAPLRDEAILIIASGNLTHNLHEAFRGQHTQTPGWVSDFAEWVAARLAAGDTESLLDWQTAAPSAIRNHPTPEHFLPFFTALGAAGTPLAAHRLFHDTAYGVLAMDAYRF